MKAYRGSKGIAPLFELGTRTLRPGRSTPGKEPRTLSIGRWAGPQKWSDIMCFVLLVQICVTGFTTKTLNQQKLQQRTLNEH